MFWLGQGLGLLSTVGAAYSFMLKSKRSYLLMHTTAHLVCLISFVILDIKKGFAMLLIGIVVELAEYFYSGRNKSTPWLLTLTFVVSYIISFIFSYVAWYDSLTLLSSLLYVVILLRMQDYFKLKLLSLICCALWLVYGIAVHHLGVIGEELLGAVTIVLSLRRTLMN